MKASFNGFNRSGEAQVVFGEQLSEILQEWKAAYLKERNPSKEIGPFAYRVKGHHAAVVGPAQYLEMQTGIDRRRIYGIMSGEYKFVPLSQVYAVLGAIDKDYLIGGLIHVIPNPSWSMESWIDYMKERGCF